MQLESSTAGFMLTILTQRVISEDLTGFSQIVFGSYAAVLGPRKKFKTPYANSDLPCHIVQPLPHQSRPQPLFVAA